MSSVSFKTTSSEEKMSMYENMVEELVGADESSRFILDGKLRKISLLHKNLKDSSQLFSLRNLLNATAISSTFYFTHVSMVIIVEINFFDRWEKRI